ncbi:MAG: hypothetical protein WA110_06355 [Anaerolineaceae bacterium]
MPDSIDEADMEFSGLAWYQDNLILLPQYPNRQQKDGLGQIYSIEKSTLLEYIADPDGRPVEFTSILFDDGGLSESLKSFEGFEAIVFNDDQVYLTIETRNGNPMMGYLVRGLVASDKITLDPESLVELPSQANFSNASDEAVTIFDGKIYTFFEDNGETQNPDPKAHVFTSEMAIDSMITFPQIEYRVTDATEVQPDGTFWVMNYFYPGDTHLAAASDPIADKFGKGPTHQASESVERILELTLTDGQIVLSDAAPIQFHLLADGESRNWEGLARLDDVGFIVVTDKFPETILGFVSALR